MTMNNNTPQDTATGRVTLAVFASELDEARSATDESG